ncbi:hypothetical protein MR642_01290 [bacterium]|nr:hypothetical protein [bacterium]
MKKSTFILSLLLAFLGVTATAQTYAYKKFAALGEKVSSLSELQNGGTYAFFNTGKNKYIKLADCITLKLNNDTGLSADDETDGLAVFTLHKVDGQENTFTIETAFSGIYMKPVVDGPCYAQATTEPASFVFRTTNSAGQDAADNRFFIKNSGNDKWFDMQPNQFVGWSGTGENARYEIYNVTLSEESVVDGYDVTINLKDQEGNLIMTNTSVMTAGTSVNFTTPLSYYYTDFTLTNTSNVVADGNTEFNYTVQKGTIPVTFSTAGNNTWYALQIMNKGTRTVKAYYDSDDAAWHVFTKPSDFNATDLRDYDGFNRAIWAFVESGTGVKLYNKGTDKYLKWTNGFATLEAAANATTFYITENPTNGRTNCFSLWTGNGNQYLNASETKGGVANARLGVWDAAGSATDNGSRFLFWSVDEANANLVNVGKDCINNITPNEADANYVTAGLAADITAASTAAASVTNIEGLDAIVAKLNYPGVDLDANAYYRIANINITKKYASTENIPTDTEGSLQGAYNADNNIDRVVRRVESTGAFVPMLWQVLPNGDGTVKIKNANNGKYWAAGNDAAVDMPINDASAFSYTLTVRPGVSINNGKTNDGKTMFQILTSGHMINAYGGNNGSILQNFDNISDAGGYWQLEKVTSVPVSISDALYASVGFPFAVQVPAASGVKAYYATAAADGELTLSEIADGIIPAYTGAILAATAATDVNLAIVTTDKSLDNKLVAATAKRTGFEANDNYMLGVDSDDEVKFLQATITTVPANKAYLPAANVTNGSLALAFNFGGESTGIANTLKDNQEVQYFDLNGRVVLYPSNGVFITNTGKKVFIK